MSDEEGYSGTESAENREEEEHMSETQHDVPQQGESGSESGGIQSSQMIVSQTQETQPHNEGDEDQEDGESSKKPPAVQMVKVVMSKNLVHELLHGVLTREERIKSGAKKAAKRQSASRQKTYIDEKSTSDAAAVMVLRRYARGGARLLNGVDTSGTDLQSPAEDHHALLNTISKNLKISSTPPFKAGGATKYSQEMMMQAEVAAVEYSVISDTVQKEIKAHKYSNESWMEPKSAELVALFHQVHAPQEKSNSKKSKKSKKQDAPKHTPEELQLICVAAIKMSRTLALAKELNDGDATFMDEKRGAKRETYTVQTDLVRALKSEAASAKNDTRPVKSSAIGATKQAQLTCRIIAHELQGTSPQINSCHADTAHNTRPYNTDHNSRHTGTAHNMRPYSTDYTAHHSDTALTASMTKREPRRCSNTTPTSISHTAIAQQHTALNMSPHNATGHSTHTLATSPHTATVQQHAALTTSPHNATEHNARTLATSPQHTALPPQAEACTLCMMGHAHGAYSATGVTSATVLHIEQQYYETLHAQHTRKHNSMRTREHSSMCTRKHHIHHTDPPHARTAIHTAGASFPLSAAMALESAEYAKDTSVVAEEAASLKGKVSILNRQATDHKAERQHWTNKVDAAEAREQKALLSLQSLREENEDLQDKLHRYQQQYLHTPASPTNGDESRGIPPIWRAHYPIELNHRFEYQSADALIGTGVMQPLRIPMTPGSPGLEVDRAELTNSTFQREGYECFTVGKIKSNNDDDDFRREDQTCTFTSVYDQILSRLILHEHYDLAASFVKEIIPAVAAA
jgi:hypothetical protein